jgi:hypothetical protein
MSTAPPSPLGLGKGGETEWEHRKETSAIFVVQVEEGMSSGGSTGVPATPAPTPFSHGPGGIRPEDLAAGISR